MVGRETPLPQERKMLADVFGETRRGEKRSQPKLALEGIGFLASPSPRLGTGKPREGIGSHLPSDGLSVLDSRLWLEMVREFDLPINSRPLSSHGMLALEDRGGHNTRSNNL